MHFLQNENVSKIVTEIALPLFILVADYIILIMSSLSVRSEVHRWSDGCADRWSTNNQISYAQDRNLQYTIILDISWCSCHIIHLHVAYCLHICRQLLNCSLYYTVPSSLWIVLADYRNMYFLDFFCDIAKKVTEFLIIVHYYNHFNQLIFSYSLSSIHDFVLPIHKLWKKLFPSMYDKEQKNHWLCLYTSSVVNLFFWLGLLDQEYVHFVILILVCYQEHFRRGSFGQLWS